MTTYYWRLKDIPELAAVPAQYRREWWREATFQSRTPQSKALSMVPIALAIMVSLWVSAGPYRNLPAWFLTYATVAAIGFLVFNVPINHWYLQPRARQWLRNHMRESGALQKSC